MGRLRGRKELPHTQSSIPSLMADTANTNTSGVIEEAGPMGEIEGKDCCGTGRSTTTIMQGNVAIQHGTLVVAVVVVVVVVAQNMKATTDSTTTEQHIKRQENRGQYDNTLQGQCHRRNMRRRGGGL